MTYRTRYVYNTIQYNTVGRNLSGRGTGYLIKFQPADLPQQAYSKKTNTTDSIHRP